MKPRSGAAHLREDEMRRHGGLARRWGPMRTGRCLKKSMPKAEVGAPDLPVLARRYLHPHSEELSGFLTELARPRSTHIRRQAELLEAVFVPLCQPSAPPTGSPRGTRRGNSCQGPQQRQRQASCGGRQRARSLYTPRASAGPTGSRQTAAVHAHSRFSPFGNVPVFGCSAPMCTARSPYEHSRDPFWFGVSGRLGIVIALCGCKVGGATRVSPGSSSSGNAKIKEHAL